MTIIAPETSVTGQQMAAALALAHLLDPEHGLPVITWQLSDHSPGLLAGHAWFGRGAAADVTELAAVTAYAQFFGAGVVVTEPTSALHPWTRLSVKADYWGVKVEVYAHVGDARESAVA